MELFEFEKLVLDTKRNLPTGEFLLNKRSLALVGKTIAKAINQSNSIVIYGDYDVDGIATSTMLQEFIEDVSKVINKNVKVDVNISTRYSSGYGMSIEKVKSLAQEYDLIIGVDHGANAEFLEEFNNEEAKMIIFDHHKSEKNNFDFVINPAEQGIKGISSGIVVKKFIDYFLEMTKIDLSPDKYTDLEALTIISDMAELNDYSRKQLQIGLKKINEKKRFCFKSNVGEVSHKDLSFGVIAKVNAVGRMRDDIDFLVEWIKESRDYKKWKITTNKIEEINNEKKNIVNKYFNKFMLEYEKQHRENDGLLLYIADDIPTGVNGLIAQRLFQLTNKETVVMSKYNGKYTGSGRGHDIYNTVKKINDAIKSTKNEDGFKFGGHDKAIGLSFQKEKLDTFSFHAKYVEVKEPEKVEILGKINVSKLKEFSTTLNSITDGIPLDRKFWFSLEDYGLQNIKRYKNNYASVQLSDGEETVNCFLNLDVIQEEHIRKGNALKVNVDELFDSSDSFRFSIESSLKYPYGIDFHDVQEERKMVARGAGR